MQVSIEKVQPSSLPAADRSSSIIILIVHLLHLFVQAGQTVDCRKFLFSLLVHYLAAVLLLFLLSLLFPRKRQDCSFSRPSASHPLTRSTRT